VVRELPPRRDLIREGDQPRAVNLILEGWACRYKQLPDGRRQTVHFFVPGDLCDANVFILEKVDHSIASITALKYAEIAPADFETLMAQSPALVRAFWLNELVNASVAREWVANVGQRSAFERIAHIFCEMFLRLESLDLTEGNSCDWPLTQADLADATGLTPVHVNRTLQQLRARELVELSGRRLVVPDLDALRRVSLFNDTYLHLKGARPLASVA
jgi:CRP-like cAMP-binding protein